MYASHLPFLEKDVIFIQSQSDIGKENNAWEILKLCKGFFFGIENYTIV